MENEKEGKGTSILDTITEGVSSITEAMTGRTQKPRRRRKRSGTTKAAAQERRTRRAKAKRSAGGRRSAAASSRRLRGNPRPAGERQSGLAQEELVPQLPPAGPHGRRLRANVLEGALKRSEAPRNLGLLKVVEGQPSAADAENET